MRIILGVAAIVAIIFLLFQPYYFGQGFLIIMACFTLLWLLSLTLKDASIVDIFWGTGFVIMAWFYRFSFELTDIRSLIFCILVSIWGLRLSIHLAFRNIGKGEDYRYQAWQKDNGKNWWWISYFRVFLLQGVLLWLISSVFAPAVSSVYSSLGIFDYLGIIFWVIGFMFEAIGDWQLTQFKKNPANKGKVLQTGLWSLTRHPNYFGDSMQWSGYFLFACTTGNYLYIFSPIIMTFLLMEVSGVALLEETLSKTKPEYADYIKRVPAFFPKLF